VPTKELFSNVSLIEKTVSEIWTVLGELSQKTPLKFEKRVNLTESDHLDLLCALIVDPSNRRRTGTWSPSRSCS
jgi:hypothetical protein